MDESLLSSADRTDVSNVKHMSKDGWSSVMEVRSKRYEHMLRR